MNFRTKIDIPKSGLRISHANPMMMMGSCFAENMGELLMQNKFNLNLNPFGILYNPKSISEALNFLLERKTFKEEDIFEYKGLYHSFWHHSRFSNVDKNQCIEDINKSIQAASADLRQAQILFITFGTSYVYELKETSQVVGNCHKLPSSTFHRYRLNVESIVTDWACLLRKLREVNPTLEIIFTISPIRHMKDGAHENQLSKSILLMAVDQLCTGNDYLHYFPSYEIVLDELRDYRFYGEDMIHPNALAVKYLWERFSDTYFPEETLRINSEWNKIYTAINHRPLNEDGEEYKHFLNLSLTKLASFKEKYPYICCYIETKELEKRLLNYHR